MSSSSMELLLSSSLKRSPAEELSKTPMVRQRMKLRLLERLPQLRRKRLEPRQKPLILPKLLLKPTVLQLLMTPHLPVTLLQARIRPLRTQILLPAMTKPPRIMTMNPQGERPSPLRPLRRTPPPSLLRRAPRKNQRPMTLLRCPPRELPPARNNRPLPASWPTSPFT